MTKNKSGYVLWFTGLSGAGKTTIASYLLEFFQKKGIRSELLDGDVMRQKFKKELGRDLGFSKEDRDKNVERAAYAASLLCKQGVIVLATLISPYRSHRDRARSVIGNFIEIYVKAPLHLCEKRDVKGLYRLARGGEILNFTGISDPYEEPESPDLIIPTDQCTVEEGAGMVVQHLTDRRILV
jgi:adenylyl-sulfate kinase